MKRFALAIALAFVLSGSTLAGDVSSPGAAPGDTQTPPGEILTPPGETQGPSLLATLLLTIITWPR